MRTNASTSPGKDKQFIATLPFRSEQRDDPDCNLDVSVWRCPENLCECQGTSRCETASGLYYGSAEDEVTKFCPRHFYEMHSGPNAAYRLIDLAKPYREQASADPSFVAMLPFNAVPTGDENDPERTVCDQAVWHCAQNACDAAGQGWCDGTGYFYGTSDSGEPKCCARHQFSDSGYTLIDMTEEEFERAVAEDHCQRSCFALRCASQRLYEAMQQYLGDVPRNRLPLYLVMAYEAMEAAWRKADGKKDEQPA